MRTSFTFHDNQMAMVIMKEKRRRVGNGGGFPLRLPSWGEMS